MKKFCRIAVCIVAGILVVMYGTCPDTRDHKAAVNAQFYAIMSNLQPRMGCVNADTAMLNRLMETGIGDYVQVKNYGIVSIGHLYTAYDEEKCSVGLFTHVFVTIDREDIMEAIYGDD